MPIVRSITARCVCQVHRSVFNWSRCVHGLCGITRTGEQFADRRRKTPNYTPTKHLSSYEHNNNGKYGWKYLGIGIGSAAAIGLTGEVIYYNIFAVLVCFLAICYFYLSCLFYYAMLVL